MKKWEIKPMKGKYFVLLKNGEYVYDHIHLIVVKKELERLQIMETLSNYKQLTIEIMILKNVNKALRAEIKRLKSKVFQH